MVSQTFTPAYHETAPLGPELGSVFSWEELIGGYDRGTVFQIESEIQKNFQQMLDTDGKAQSVENLLVFPIIAAPREIVPSKGDKGEAEKLNEILTAAPYEEGMSTSLENIVLQMAGAMTYKKSFFEKVFKIRESDGLVGYKKIAWRSPDTCELALDAKTGEYRGFRQRKITYEWRGSFTNDFGYVNINLDKAFVYIYGSWKDPVEGISAMQVPYWCFQTKRRLMYLWYQYLETTSLPKTIVSNPDETKARADARKVATLKSRGVLGIENSSNIDTLESAGHGATQFIEAIRFLDSEMSQSVLGGFMDLTTSAASGKGSFALSEDQSKLFLRTRRVVARDMARQFNEQVIAPICHYNFGRDSACPRLVFGPLSEANEQVVLDTFNKMATAPSVAVPDEFYDELVVRVASVLELDPERVQKAIQTEGSPLERLRQATEVATGAIETNEANQNGQTELTAKEFLEEAESVN